VKNEVLGENPVLLSLRLPQIPTHAQTCVSNTGRRGKNQPTNQS